MVREDYEIIEETSEITYNEGYLTVMVSVSRYEEEYKGASRGEEYYERTDFDEDVLEVECPIEYIYRDSDPNEDYTGSDAKSFIRSQSWDSQKVVDVETMEFREDGELWVATFSSDPLSEYRD